MTASVSRRVSVQLALGIFFVPWIFVWFLIRPGYSQFAKVMAFGWMGLLLISFLIPGGSTKPASVQKIVEAPSQGEKETCKKEEKERMLKYEAAFAEGNYFDAALHIKACAEILGSPSLREKLSAAMIADRVGIINSPNSAPGEKLEAMEYLAREYPEEGRKYETRIPKLKILVERETARLAAKSENEQKQRKKREGIALGMTAADVRASSWGAPRDINRTINKWGVSEQWVYDGGYVYFENGVVTSIQN